MQITYDAFYFIFYIYITLIKIILLFDKDKIIMFVSDSEMIFCGGDCDVSGYSCDDNCNGVVDIVICVIMIVDSDDRNNEID